MNADIEKLAQLLDEEAGIFRRMISVLDTEKEAAIAADLDILLDTRLEKEHCVYRLKAAAGRKEKLLEQVAGSLPEPPDVYTFTALIPMVETGSAGKLRAAREKITSLVKVADSKNRENAIYLEQGLKTARNTLALVENSCNPQTTYKKTGQVKTGSRTGRLLSRNY